MLVFTDPLQAGGCRTYPVDVCDPVLSTSTSTVPIDQAATFQIRQRDALDFTIDFTALLTAMGVSVTLTACSFTVPAASPKTPASITGGFDASGTAVFVLTPALGATVGDLYYVDVTATTSTSVLPNTPSVTIPARTITRRMQFQVVAG